MLLLGLARGRARAGRRPLPVHDLLSPFAVNLVATLVLDVLALAALVRHPVPGEPDRGRQFPFGRLIRNEPLQGFRVAAEVGQVANGFVIAFGRGMEHPGDQFSHPRGRYFFFDATLRGRGLCPLPRLKLIHQQRHGLLNVLVRVVG